MTTLSGASTNWIGQPLLREEDERFLRGAGRFTDDLHRPEALHAQFVRSPHAHARLLGIDATAALAMEGVQCVLTAKDIKAETIGPIPSMNEAPPFDIRNRDGGTVPDGSQPILADGKVRYAGEPVAMVVAASASLALEAAEHVEVSYQELPPSMSYARATAPGATPIWDELKSNASLDWRNADNEAIEPIFANAAHVIACELDNNRISPCFMEPRAAIASYDGTTKRFRLEAGCQSTHGLKGGIATLMGIEPESIQVLAPDTGGGFGARGSVYPEYIPLLIAARRLSRPVRWTSTRAEGFLSDAQSRDHRMRGELALDAEGNFLAIKVTIKWRHGSYLGGRNVWVMVSFLPPTIGGVYRIANARIDMQGAFSNTTPQAAFRGIGRVESNYLMERLIDVAARELGFDAIDLRRRNMLESSELPFTAAGGAHYTTGEFRANLERALELSGYADFKKRQSDSQGRGMRRGLGLAMFIENDGGAPTEFAEVTAVGNGKVTVYAGTQDFGMGHRTIYKQIAAQGFGLHIDDIDVVYGDTDQVKTGAGSHGSRSARIGGSAIVVGVRKLIDRARALAGERLEAAPEDIEYAAGVFTIAGTDRTVSLFELAATAEERGERLTAEAEFETKDEAHSNGCLVCEVEVDPETGKVAIKSHTMVMDVGRAINPLIVDGQLHGGAAQGLGQAGFEAVVYDDDSGQTLTGSFMDYNIPKADDLPMFTVELNEVIEPDNPLGVKGAGESATSGSPAALVNAVVNALAPLGVKELQMPLTPLRVWEAIQEARQ